MKQSEGVGIDQIIIPLRKVSALEHRAWPQKHSSLESEVASRTEGHSSKLERVGSNWGAHGSQNRESMSNTEMAGLAELVAETSRDVQGLPSKPM